MLSLSDWTTATVSGMWSWLWLGRRFVVEVGLGCAMGKLRCLEGAQQPLTFIADHLSARQTLLGDVERSTDFLV